MNSQTVEHLKGIVKCLRLDNQTQFVDTTYLASYTKDSTTHLANIVNNKTTSRNDRMWLIRVEFPDELEALIKELELYNLLE